MGPLPFSASLQGFGSHLEKEPLVFCRDWNGFDQQWGGFFHLLPLPLISTCPGRRKDLMNCKRMGLALPSQGSFHEFISFFQVGYGKSS